MTKKITVAIICIVILVIVVIIVPKKDRTTDPYLDFIQNSVPWKNMDFNDAALYLKDEHILITFNKQNSQYWLADLNDFYDYFYNNVLDCKNPDERCSPWSLLKGDYTVQSIVFSIPDNRLDLQILTKDTWDKPTPEIYDLTGTLEGKNIRIP